MKRPMKGKIWFDDVENNKTKNIGGAEEYSGRTHSECLPAVEAALGKVFCQPRRVL